MSYEQDSRKRLSEGQDNTRDAKRYNSGNEPLLKLLVPNYTAGALIGKGGSVLNEIKETYGGFIRLSGGREYYPGTEERVVVITGQVNQIIDINNHVMEKVLDPGREPTMKNVSIDEERVKKVKIVLTDGAAGLLIGKGGATIKSIQEESKARVSVGMREKASVPGERVVTVSGSFDERTEACRQVIEKIAGDTSNMANTKTKYISGNISEWNTGYSGTSPALNNRQQDSGNQYSGNAMSGNQYSGNTMSGNQYSGNGISGNQYSGTTMSAYQGGNNAGSHSYQSGPEKLKAKVQIELQVPNVMVGALLGRQGSVIKDFVQRSGGARFKFEDKSEGPDRTLTITGDMDQTQAAYSLMNDRVEQLKNQPISQGSFLP